MNWDEKYDLVFAAARLGMWTEMQSLVSLEFPHYKLVNIIGQTLLHMVIMNHPIRDISQNDTICSDLLNLHPGKIQANQLTLLGEVQLYPRRIFYNAKKKNPDITEYNEEGEEITPEEITQDAEAIKLATSMSRWYENNPLSLRQLCILKVRQQLTSLQIDCVHQLPLPHKLCQIVCLYHLLLPHPESGTPPTLDGSTFQSSRAWQPRRRTPQQFRRFVFFLQQGPVQLIPDKECDFDLKEYDCSDYDAEDSDDECDFAYSSEKSANFGCSALD
jgi:hypothetical protein